MADGGIVRAKRPSFNDRLQAAIPAVIAARDAFLERVKIAATRDQCAALMAEAIDMQISANGLEVVGKDGRVRVSIEEIAAAHCALSLLGRLMRHS